MTDHESKAIGEHIGNYRLVRLVGSGGFADVYLGEHQHLGTYAAIKVLHTKLSGEQIELFRQEARMLAHLLHPHIVRVLDFDVENQFPFLVMDYAPGGTLRQQHPRDTIVPLPTVIGYLRQIASALDYAHDQKLIHRDVKPENMLIDQQGQIMLSDFGVSYMVHSSRSQTLAEMAGTISYIAPEQIQGRPHLASDQYALGVVIYEWLSGERPFQGSVTEIVSQHLVAPPPPLHGRIAGISPTVENVLFTALEKNPRDRFATVQTFVRALEQAFRDGSTGVAYPSSTLDAYDVHEDITQPSQASSAQRASLPTPVPLAKPDASSLITLSPPNEMSPIPSTPLLSFAGEPSEPLAPPSAQADEVPVLPAQQMASSGLAEPQPIAASTPPIVELMRLAQQRWPVLAYLSTVPHARRNLLVAGGIIFLLVLLITSNTLYALTHASAHPTRTMVNSNTGLTATAPQPTTMPPTGTTSKVALPEPTPKPTPTSMPISISKPVPTSTSGLVPTPMPTPTLEPTSTPTPEPTPTPTPEPTPTPTPVPTPTPTPICPAQIQYGSVGTEVKTLQNALNNHSFPDSPYTYTRPLAVDGQFGPQVQAAVKDFQSSRGLQVDGQVGPLTWRALGYC